MAKGLELDNAVNGIHTGYERVVAGELFVLIVPGYLIVPFIVAPLACHLLPFLFASLIVRSRRNFATRQAERAMEHPHFDIVWRYAEFVNNFTVCTFLLFFVSPGGWKVFAVLIVSLCMIYTIDYISLLRYTTQTPFTSDSLSDVFAFMWSIPLAVVLASTLWWGFKVLKYSILVPVAAILVHFILYCALVWIIRSWCKSKLCSTGTCDSDSGYMEMIERLETRGIYHNYFNTNPIFCLRKRLIPDNNEPCGSVSNMVFPYHPGKVYLQAGARKSWRTKPAGV